MIFPCIIHLMSLYVLVQIMYFHYYADFVFEKMFSLDSCNVNEQSTPLYESLLGSMVIADYYNPGNKESFVDFLCDIRSWKKLAWLGIEPTILDLGSQSVAFDHSAMVTPAFIGWGDINLWHITLWNLEGLFKSKSGK